MNRCPTCAAQVPHYIDLPDDEADEPIIFPPKKVVAKMLGEIIGEDGLTNSQRRIAELERILHDILVADERGQGLPFAEAMERAHKAMKPK